MRPEYGALLVMVLLTTAGQLGAKTGALRLRPGKGLRPLLRSAFNLPLLAGTGAVLTAPLFYFYALARIPLSQAYGFTALNYILVHFAGTLFLGEKKNRYHTAGILCIAAGVAVWSL